MTALALAVLFAASMDTSHYVENRDPAVRASIETFRDRKLAIMMHFGLYSQVGIVESWPLVDADAHWARREVERDAADGDAFKKAYFALNRSFNPIRYRPEAWADAIVRSGAKYVIFTTKHHDGFCLYDTEYADYKTTDPSCPFSANPRADITKTFFDACRVRGLGVTAYFSKADWHHPDYWDNCGIGIRTTRNPSYDIEKDLPRWKRFQDFTKNQLLELVRNYGPLDGLWLDGGWIYGEGPKSLNLHDVIAEARKTTPGLLAVDRWQCTDCEDYVTPEQFVPEEPVSVPWESCITLADNWGYHYDDGYKSIHEVIHLLVDVVAKGGNLALNVGPMPDGRLPHPAVQRLDALGAWLKKNGAAIYATRVQEPYKSGPWAYTQSKDGKRLFAIRLWKEGEREFHTTDFPYGKFGVPKRIVHLASGKDIPLAVDADRRVILNFPADFVRDAHADAFEIFPAAPAPANAAARETDGCEAKVAAVCKVSGCDTWYGHRRVKFEFQGHKAWIVEPSAKAEKGYPWTWTMQWAEAFVERTGVPQMLKRGYHHVTIDLFETRMDEKGLEAAAAFQKFLVETLGFDAKANLIGMSWGGFFSTRYAAACPANVARIYLDAPLLNFEGFSKANPDRIGVWRTKPPAEGSWATDPRMPVNLADALAKTGIPILLAYGGQDQTVNPASNSELFAARFSKAGGRITTIPRPLFGHHPHGLEHGDDRIVSFLTEGSAGR